LHNFVEPAEGAWRIGGEVESKLQGDNLTAQESVWEYGASVLFPHQLKPDKVVLVYNPCEFGSAQLSLGMSTRPHGPLSLSAGTCLFAGDASAQGPPAAVP